MLGARAVLLTHLHNVCRGLGLTVRGPRIHQLAALLQRITPPVGLFGLVPDDVGQSCLHDFAGEARDVSRPIPEAGAEAVNGGVFDLHPAQDHFHRHIRKRLVARLPGKNEIARLEFFKLAQDSNRPNLVQRGLLTAACRRAPGVAR